MRSFFIGALMEVVALLALISSTLPGCTVAVISVATLLLSVWIFLLDNWQSILKGGSNKILSFGALRSIPKYAHALIAFAVLGLLVALLPVFQAFCLSLLFVGAGLVAFAAPFSSMFRRL